MVTAGLALAGVAALLHVYIFHMESIAWVSPRVRAVFRTTADEAEATRQLAFNQGFYNLFLAVMAMVGIGAFVAGAGVVGATLIFAGAGSMTAAALVLGLSSPRMAAAALKQGAFPAAAVVALALGLFA